MPIDYKKYPKDWKQIRERILKRANNKCECCGIENHIVVSSYKKDGKTVWVLDAYTVSNNYPYSQYSSIEHDGIKEKINYIRNY